MSIMSKVMIHLFAASLVLSGALGCSDEPVEPIGTDVENGAGGKADETGEGELLPDAAEVMAQDYALIIDTWLKTAEDEDDEPKEWRAQFRGRAVRVVDEAGAKLYVMPCQVALPELDGRTIEMAPEALQSVSSLPVDLALTGELASPQLQTPQMALIAGAELENPVSDELPATDDDERLVDIDDDGEPGMTVTIDGYRVYVGLRYRFELDGEIAEDQSATGDAAVRIDIEVYGDSVPFVNVKKSLDKALGKLELVDEKHAFLMQPLAPEDASCDAVAAIEHTHVYAE
ncbi:MAG: hypothetical protein ACON3Z_19250 [Bradymonadia bacterium]